MDRRLMVLEANPLMGRKWEDAFTLAGWETYATTIPEDCYQGLLSLKPEMSLIGNCSLGMSNRLLISRIRSDVRLTDTAIMCLIDGGFNDEAAELWSLKADDVETESSDPEILVARANAILRPRLIFGRMCAIPRRRKPRHYWHPGQLVLPFGDVNNCKDKDKKIL